MSSNPTNNNNNRKNKKGGLSRNQRRKLNAAYRMAVRGRGRRRRFYPRQNLQPLVQGSSFTNLANITTRGGHTYLRVRELVSITTHVDVFDFVIPACPTRWVGTRTATISQTYSAYRPLRFVLHYQPLVAATTNGSISIGTIFDGLSATFTTKEQAYAALPSTNGGFATTIYSRMSRSIQLGTALRANNFPTSDLSQDDIPFFIVGTVQGGLAAGTVIGNLILEATFSLVNPINRVTAIPVALNVGMSIDVDSQSQEDPQPRYLTLAKSLVNTALEVGTDYMFCFNDPLYDTDANVLNRVLKMLPLNLTSVTQTAYKFLMETVTASTNALTGSLIGTATNLK